jgi:hypothetical protein
MARRPIVTSFPGVRWRKDLVAIPSGRLKSLAAAHGGFLGYDVAKLVEVECGHSVLLQ